MKTRIISFLAGLTGWCRMGALALAITASITSAYCLYWSVHTLRHSVPPGIDLWVKLDMDRLPTHVDGYINRNWADPRVARMEGNGAYYLRGIPEDINFLRIDFGDFLNAGKGPPVQIRELRLMFTVASSAVENAGLPLHVIDLLTAPSIAFNLVEHRADGTHWTNGNGSYAIIIPPSLSAVHTIASSERYMIATVRTALFAVLSVMVFLASFSTTMILTWFREKAPQGWLERLIGGSRGSETPELDGVRGMAALIVVFGHFMIFSRPVNDFMGPFAKQGVWLFFILSSYLLATILSSQLNSGNYKAVIASYFSKRVCRIFPMYIATLFTLLCIPAFERFMFAASGFSFIDHVTLRWPKGVFWSISAEFEYYFILPLIVVACGAMKEKHRPKLIMAVVAAAIADAVYLYANMNPGWSQHPHFYVYLPIFLFGTALGLGKVCVDNGVLPQPSPRTALRCLLTGLVLLAIDFQPIRSLLQPVLGNLDQIFAQSSTAGAAWALIMVGIVWGPQRLSEPFRWKGLRYVGVVSYSVYMTHILVFSVLAPLTLPSVGFAASLVIFIAGILALSGLTYVVIEAPFIRLAHIGGRTATRTKASQPLTCP
ncbi:acyltransferase [Magnetospirillum sp. 15-1]|uniref:acyltransferase family protein n=1 Tax=Magnetospirillum sp. 15-1 TaxID=1979370 RepID=UPI000BBC1017|nr:acyltransferase [Magnetospirillum sp. 15-1]